MTAATVIQIIADWAVVPVVLIGAWSLLVYVPKGRRFEAYARVLLAGLTVYMVAKFVGTIYQPATERPYELLGLAPGASYLDNPGFPSDHALFVAAIACAVWFETKRRRVSLVLALFVIVVCVGRVVALVHTPADVIAGVFIALLGAAWYMQPSIGTKKYKPVLQK